MWLCLENEEEVEVSEEKAPPPSDSQAGFSVFTLTSAGLSLTHLLTKASPGAFAIFLDVFKIFLTCLLH
jgi:hypothetical protein